MTNRDMPAHPGTQRAWPKDGPIDGVLIATDGLTKRETAAIAAMQGLLANHEASASIQEDAIEAGIHPADNMASIAVYAADALFDELEKTEPAKTEPKS